MSDFFKLAAALLHPVAQPMPRAWLGMSPAFERPTVRICARCPDKSEAEEMATEAGLDMTHGECLECHEAFMRILNAARELKAARIAR